MSFGQPANTAPALLGAPPAAQAMPSLATVKEEVRYPDLGQEQPIGAKYQYIVSAEGAPEQWRSTGENGKEFGVVVKTIVKVHAVSSPGGSTVGQNLYGVRIKGIGDFSGNSDLTKTAGYRALREMRGIMLAFLGGPDFGAEAGELSVLQARVKAGNENMLSETEKALTGQAMEAAVNAHFAIVQQAWLAGSFSGAPFVVNVQRKQSKSLNKDTQQPNEYFACSFLPYKG